MNILLDELQTLLQIRSEDERIEFKEAKVDFSIEKLAKYCVALSNEGGGKLVLGVTDRKPRFLPMLSKDQVQKLLKELKLQGSIFNQGSTRSALWYPASIAPK